MAVYIDIPVAFRNAESCTAGKIISHKYS